MASEEKALNDRFNKTMSFLESVVKPPTKILDLGVENPLSEIMTDKGYYVINTRGDDLDLFPDEVGREDVEVVTAFEILEHLVSPFSVLQKIRARKLIVTVPLRLWFARAYKNSRDSRDRHFHEFEDWQFDWLIDKAGWEIVKSEKWTSPTKKIGIRPILRYFTPRYYAVYAVRKRNYKSGM